MTSPGHRAAVVWRRPARSGPAPAVVSVDFRHGDTAGIPFEAESFDLAVCQAPSRTSGTRPLHLGRTAPPLTLMRCSESHAQMRSVTRSSWRIEGSGELNTSRWVRFLTTECLR